MTKLFLFLLSPFFMFHHCTNLREPLQNTPEATVQHLISLAKQKLTADLPALCDPLKRNDGDTQQLCAITPENKANYDFFVNCVAKARLSGNTRYGTYKQTKTARVPISFPRIPACEPLVMYDEEMVLVQVKNKWYLLDY